MDDLIQEFIIETNEALSVLDEQLVVFEQNPKDTDTLSNIFRLLHTIKGTCGFLGLPRLEKVAHAGEDVLGKIRDGELDVSPEAVTLVLKCLDQIRALVEELESTGNEPDGDDAELVSALRAMAEGQAPAAAPAPATASPASDSGPVTSDEGFPVAAELLEEVAAAETASDPVTSDEGFPVAAELLEEVAAAEAADGPVTSDEGFPVAAELLEEVAAAEGAAADSKAEDEAAAAAMEAAMAAAQEPEPAPEPKPAKSQELVKADNTLPETKKRETQSTQTIRVNVDVLENLMNLVSEIVLTRNQLIQKARGLESNEMEEPLQRLNLITSDLQEGVMKTRMQPIGNAWNKLPRIVRDLSNEMGKKIDLVMEGKETELDRQVLEMIRDPLTHMVRNSADHGLELPADRIAAGKPEVGTVRLSAFHEGGHIIIRIEDDGKGISVDKVRDKVLEKGLATEEELAGMEDNAIRNFILKAGFSTAEKVTSVSGRGVGMDVVRTNIEQIGGTIEFESEEGQGSTFTLKIPLTLAIVPALVVGSSDQRFAIPQISVQEVVLASESSEHKIESIDEAPILRLRDTLLPLIDLAGVLQIKQPSQTDDDEHQTNGRANGEANGHANGEANGHTNGEANGHALNGQQGISISSKSKYIVVTQVGSQRFGIIIDSIYGTEEIVVKPVSKVLKDVSHYSGSTILGDGSVIMILDPNYMWSQMDHRTIASDTADQSEVDHRSHVTSMLLFRTGDESLKAVPLPLVARLEDVEAASIEVVQSKRVVQYRGQLMPLVPADPGYVWPDSGHINVIVFAERERAMGVVIDEIVDIIEESLDIQMVSDRPGISGSTILDGRAVDLLDTSYYLKEAFGNWFDRQGHDGRSIMRGEGKTLLLVEDSAFFRNLIIPVLTMEGYEVVTADNPKKALELKDQGLRVDAIISDIEMPEMDGFEFAEAVRDDADWGEIPMVAISSQGSDPYLKRGVDAGFKSYLSKNHHEELVSIIEQVLQDAGGAA